MLIHALTTQSPACSSHTCRHGMPRGQHTSHYAANAASAGPVGPQNPQLMHDQERKPCHATSRKTSKQAVTRLKACKHCPNLCNTMLAPLASRHAARRSSNPTSSSRSTQPPKDVVRRATGLLLLCRVVGVWAAWNALPNAPVICCCHVQHMRLGCRTHNLPPEKA